MTLTIEPEYLRKLSADDIKQAISPKLAELRILNNYTLEQISSLTGLSPAKIRSLEKGQQTHTWGQYQRLLDFYNKQIRILISLEDKP